MRNEGLTKRELDVLKLVASGFSDKGIAQKLFISDYTVRTHLVSIYRKLGIATNTEYNQRVLLVCNVLRKIAEREKNDPTKN